jgi:hypothetical protein
MAVQMFRSQGHWNPAGRDYSCHNSYLPDVCSRLDFVAVGTLFSAWSPRKGNDIGAFSALAVQRRDSLSLYIS